MYSRHSNDMLGLQRMGQCSESAYMQYGGRKACDGEEKCILRMSVMLSFGVIPGRSASDVEAKCEVKNIDIIILQNRNAAGVRMCSGMCFSFLCHVVRVIIWRNICPNFVVFVLFRCMFMFSDGQLRRFYVTGKPVLSYQMCFSVCS